MKSKIRTLLLAIMLASPLFLIAQPGITSPGLNISVPAQIYANQSFTVTYSVYHSFSQDVTFTITGDCSRCTPMAGACLPFSAPAFTPTTCAVIYNLNNIPAGTNVTFTASATFTNPDAMPFPLPGSFAASNVTVMALPVELIYFDSKVENSKVSLSWATATEIENEVFLIERSVDGNKFESIGKVAGAGNSQVQLNYEFVDENPEKGLNYYRLKQMDFDGSYEYSDVVSVIYTEKGDGVNVYPNPSNQLAYLAFDEGLDNPTEINIFDALGKLVKSINTTGQDLDGRVELDLSDLQRGSYMVNVQFGRETISTRLQKI